MVGCYILRLWVWGYDKLVVSILFIFCCEVAYYSGSHCLRLKEHRTKSNIFQYWIRLKWQFRGKLWKTHLWISLMIKTYQNHGFWGMFSQKSIHRPSLVPPCPTMSHRASRELAGAFVPSPVTGIGATARATAWFMSRIGRKIHRFYGWFSGSTMNWKSTYNIWICLYI